MEFEATNRTAAIAGIWSSTGLLPFEARIKHAKITSGLAYDLMWLAGAAVFFFLAAFFLVIGRNTGAFSRTWIFDPTERAEYWIVVQRMLVWFFSAGASGLLISSAVNYFSTH